jgi:hypothetical protein
VSARVNLALALLLSSLAVASAQPAPRPNIPPGALSGREREQFFGPPNLLQQWTVPQAPQVLRKKSSKKCKPGRGRRAC